MDRLSWVVVALLVLGAVVWVALAPAAPAAVDDDHRMYVNTVHAMRAGAGYYDAMAAEVERHYGGPPGSVRAFRLPTVFLAWRLVPTEWLWPLFAVFVAIGSGVVAVRAARPYAGLLVTTWLLVTGYTITPAGWAAQWAVVEFWAVPLALAAAWRHDEDDDLGAAGLATAAALVRELTVPLLGVGLVVAWRRGRRRWPWLVGMGLWGVVYAVHAVLASSWLAPSGAERPLLGSAHAASVVEMATVNGPWVLVAAWVAAIAVVVVEGRWMYAPLVAVPLLGLVVDRDYWGILTVPAVLVLLLAAGARTAVDPDARVVGGGGGGRP